ncbi:MAG: MarR family transcriptional regulator [Candidatus Woesearchaeota archaeon]
MIDFACKRFSLDEVIKCGLGLTKADYTLLMYLIDHNEEWQTTAFLAKETRLDQSTVQRSMKKLHEKEIVEKAQENLSGGGYTFIYKAKNKEHIKEIIVGIINNWSSHTVSQVEKWAA